MKNFDVVIVGAGIGGLVCGTYLAKMGFKVIIFERQDKPGGCCTSFGRGSYKFDVGVHYLGSCREGGVIFQILKDFSLLDEIDLIDQDPHDRIITPNEDILIFRNVNKTIKELYQYFPREKENLKELFKFILNSNLPNLYLKTRHISFSKLLSKFVDDSKLKAILSIPIGNIGTPPSLASSFISLMLYKEYILDGGYYPRGGIQRYPDLLAFRFKEYGGELRLSTSVKEIFIKRNKVLGVGLDNGERVMSKFVVSNCDASTIFNHMIKTNTKEKETIRNLTISDSAFVVYLGLKKNITKIRNKNPSVCLWYFSSYDIDKCFNVKRNYMLEKNLIKRNNLDYLICHFPSLADNSLAPSDQSILRTEIWVNQKDINKWQDHKFYFYELVLKKLQEIIPEVKGLICMSEIATPLTIRKWVGNTNGAIFGWTSSIMQEDKNLFPSRTSVSGLYITGSWAINGFGQCGIPIVSLSGKMTADSVRREMLSL